MSKIEESCQSHATVSSHPAITPRQQERRFAAREFLLSAAFIVPFLQAEAARAQEVSQAWAGLDPVTKDYNAPAVPYSTPQEACLSYQNSFVPRFGYQVYSLISVDSWEDTYDPGVGINVPAIGCRMDAGENGTPHIVALQGCTGGDYKLVQSACLPSYYPVTAEPTCKGSKGGTGQFPIVGDPCTLSSGAKVENVTDYSSGGPYPIEIKRTYRSVQMPSGSTGTGVAWRSELAGRRMNIVSYDLGDPYNIVISRDDGAESRFLNNLGPTTLGFWNQFSIESYQQNGEQYVQGVGDAKDRLKRTGYTSFDYVDENDRVDTYQGGGGPTKSVWKGGYQRNYVYATDDYAKERPLQINDSLGRVVDITWTGDLISEITVPSGTRIQYAYESLLDVNGQGVPGTEVLTQVTRRKADGTVIDIVSYQYDRNRQSTKVPLLTGIVDAKGVLIDSTTYDPSGRVFTAQGPGGADEVTIAYDDTASTRTVTNALGQVNVYTMLPDTSWMTEIHPILKLRSIARQASATVPAATMSQSSSSTGFLDSRTDWNGAVTNYTYDALGNETQRVEDAGSATPRTVTTTWSSAFRLPTQIVVPNLTTNFTYDTAGRMTRREEIDTSQRQTVTRAWTYTWNALGLLETVNGPRTDVVQTTTYTYDANGNLATVKDALNRVTTVNSVNAAGLPTSITDPNNVVTLMTYDPVNRIKSVSVQGPTSATTSFGYDENGLLTSITSPANVVLTYIYDDARRLKAIQDAHGNAMVFALDGLGNRTQTQVQTASAQVLMANSATFDSLGRLLTSIGASNQTTRFEYDGNGNQTKVTDPRNAITQTAFDGLNRIKQVTDPLNGVTKLAYDAQDNVTSVTDARLHATTYTTNGFGFVTEVISPDSGTTIYTYDLAGNVKSRKDARKIVTNYTYDALDRPLTRTYPTATENVTYGYDSTAGGNLGIGRLTSLTDSAGTATFTYDAYGNRVSEKRTIGTNNYITSYGYDLAGNLTQITYPSGAIVSYQRDDLAQVSGVTFQQNAAATPVTLASNITYKPFGGVEAMTLGNGVQRTNSYDLDYRLSRIQTGTAQDLTLSYDGSSNVNSITNAVDPTHSQTFQYDLAGHVTQGTGLFGTDNYTYDAMGNRLTRSLVNGTTASTTYAYTAANTRLASSTSAGVTTSYTYDATGAVTAVKKGNQTLASYTFNNDARLLTAGTATLKYNGFGERSIETINGGGTHFLFAENGSLLAEHAIQGTLGRNYIYLNGAPFALVDAAGTVSYILNDHLDQPQKMLDSAGAVAWHRAAGVYGDTASQLVGSSGSNPLRFPGQQFSANAGIVYNFSRDYDPAIGRYLEPDRIGQSGGWNLYSYAGQNPVNFVDANGEIIQSAIGAAGSVISGYAIAKLTGQCYTLRDGLVDAALGAAGAGLFSKFKKLQEINELRGLAKTRGLTPNKITPQIEDFINNTNHIERLKIKKVGSLNAPGKLSSGPRVEYRVAPGQYRNPFTGEVGSSPDLSHVPLGKLGTGEAAGAGATAGLLSGATCPAECD